MDVVACAASIATLFQTVSDLYRFWHTYRTTEAESAVILNKLIIEETRFKLWGERWYLEFGFGKKFLASFSNQPTILAIVKNIL
jgi:hypothetical protein